MTAAVVALAVLAAGLGAALVWALREARSEGRLALASAKKVLDAMSARAEAERERDKAVAAHVAAAASREVAEIESQRLAKLLAAARTVIAKERKRAVIEEADPARKAALVDQLLLEQLREDEARTAGAAGGRGEAADHGVPAARPATDGPRPAWTDLAGD